MLFHGIFSIEHPLSEAGGVPDTKLLYHIKATVIGSLPVKIRKVLTAAAARGPTGRFLILPGIAKSAQVSRARPEGGGRTAPHPD